ncbi:SAM-dependent methyltransferase [Kineosporia babensis]|uniref:SAM-dependent methyltransferase n=1 Tax=Kineosporia babensis TaxID=499548 RepID=A0A9X1NJM5_9ACTN|nr:SAM-dependent methyltransferase [Kineosporia babensis]MCD5314406.1 SAM-dependent methyltransferase [Kineosporia babensis]
MTDPRLSADTTIDSGVPQSARIWNYWLGGTNNFAADRAAGDEVLARIPDIALGARADRAFLQRVVRFLIAEADVRQFLDIGAGLPTENNTHEVAQSLDPACRVVYVDNDPLVLEQAQALLVSTPEGASDYVQADLREPAAILTAAARTLDFSRPVGLMLLGVVNHLMDDGQAQNAVAQLVSAMPAGSYLVLTHSTAEIHGDAMLEVMHETTQRGGTPIRARNPGEIAVFFKTTDLLEPGVVSCSRWRPEDEETDPPTEVYLFGGVGRIQLH